MRFARAAESRAFAASVDARLRAADVPSAVRAWAAGEHRPGLAIWSTLADLGVTALAIGEEHDGVGAAPDDLASTFEVLGYHGVPGPLVESIAVLPALLTGELADRHLPALAGGAVGTVAMPPHVPYLLDADIADLRWAVADGSIAQCAAPAGQPLGSVDPSRRLFVCEPLAAMPLAPDAVGSAVRAAAFATSAQLLGAGRRLLDDTVAYAKVRAQYGHPIGEYQAVKHLLADVAVRLELAAPLVHGAAVALGRSTGACAVDLDCDRDVSAARVAAAEAAHLAARTALQVHGAIGYTAEYDLGLWLTKVFALQSSWGTQRFHRDRVLAAVTRRVVPV